MLVEDEMDLYIIGDILENVVDFVSKYFFILICLVRERNVFFYRWNNEEKEVVEK